MPRRKIIETFPPVFEKLVREALAAINAPTPDGVLFRYVAASPGQAQNIILQLRQYIKLLTEGSEDQAWLFNHPQLSDIAPMAQQIAVRAMPLEDGTKRVVEVIPRDSLIAGKAVTAMLEEALKGARPLLPLAAPSSAPPPPRTKAEQEQALAAVYGGKKK